VDKKSAEKPKKDKPPTAVAALEMFLDLSDQYLRYTEGLRSIDTISEGYEHNTELDASRLLRMALLRKFVSEGENLCLRRILAHYVTVARSERQVPKAEIRVVDDLRAEYKRAKRPIFAMRYEGMEWVEASQIFDLMLNGNVLHADYEKWKTSHKLNQTQLMVQVTHMVNNFEKLLVRVRAIVTGDEEPISDLLEKYFESVGE